MLNISPVITVLMPVYNCANYVSEAIESIVNQSFSDFEFLIIDDASTDETVSTIKSFEDHRIKLIVKPFNTGYTNSLNYGLSIAKGKYIARMDGDDISLSERFAKQVAFMDLHKNVVACGTRYKILNSEIVKNLPINNEDIKVQLLQKTCFGHPTVMIRKSILDANSLQYDVSKEPAEDYDLWVRLVKYGELYNLPDILLKYRVHPNQVSQNRIVQKNNIAVEIRLNMLNYLDLDLDFINQQLLRKVISRKKIDFNEIKIYKHLKKKIIKANAIGFFNNDGFQNYLLELETCMFKDFFLKRKNFSLILIFQSILS